MNNKKTEVILYEPEFRINITDNMVSVGSCFSDEISGILEKKSVCILSNPFGTIYNCHSIHNVFDAIFTCKKYATGDLVFESGKYVSMDHATFFDSDHSEKALSLINASISKSFAYFNNADVFIITPGTSVVYVYKKTGNIAANCHKLPHELFERKILSVEENANLLRDTVKLIRSRRPDAKIIFTLSPIRHTPQDPVENGLSKSFLRSAIAEVVAETKTAYFPSYEILMDELRDYSFYKKDGVHLKKKTIGEIIDRFIRNFFAGNFLAFINEYENCSAFLLHNPSNPGSIEYLKALKKNFEKLCGLDKIKKSPVIEKDIIISVIRMIDNSYECSLESLVDSQLKKFLVLLIGILVKGEPVLDEEALKYENRYYKKLGKVKRRIMAAYYRNIGEFKKSTEIMFGKE